MKYYKRKDCIYCKSTQLEKFLSLGFHPPSNSFILPDETSKEERFPLNVYFCCNCSLAQLTDIVSGDSIFDDYHYLSSSSKALVNHFSQMTKDITKRFNLKSGDLVIDIGCNDGITLNNYPVLDLVKVGVEPSNVASIAQAQGLNIIKSFFSGNVAEKIFNDYGKAKIITATNVFAHIDDMHSFMKGIPKILDDEGYDLVSS